MSIELPPPDVPNTFGGPATYSRTAVESAVAAAVAPLQAENAALRAALAAQPAPQAEPTPNGPNALLEWACYRWRDEVEHRPIINVKRRPLDDAWRQVVRFAGGDPDELLGPRHDELVQQNPALFREAAKKAAEPTQAQLGKFLVALYNESGGDFVATDDEARAIWKAAREE